MSEGLKRNWPLIRYAGSAAETSIGSKPIGSELRPKSTLLDTAVKKGTYERSSYTCGDFCCTRGKLLNLLGSWRLILSGGN